MERTFAPTRPPPNATMVIWDANSAVKSSDLGEVDVKLGRIWVEGHWIIFYSEPPSTNGVTNARIEGAGIRLFVKIRGWLLVFSAGRYASSRAIGVCLSGRTPPPPPPPPRRRGAGW